MPSSGRGRPTPGPVSPGSKKPPWARLDSGPLSSPHVFSPDPFTPDSPVQLQTGCTAPCQVHTDGKIPSVGPGSDVRSRETGSVLLPKAQGDASRGLVTGLVQAGR